VTALPWCRCVQVIDLPTVLGQRFGGTLRLQFRFPKLQSHQLRQRDTDLQPGAEIEAAAKGCALRPLSMNRRRLFRISSRPLPIGNTELANG
jgi:hypothetical protein